MQKLIMPTFALVINLAFFITILGACTKDGYIYNYLNSTESADVIINAAVLKTTSPVIAAPLADTKELKCLADNIYFESLIEPIAGQIAVANVTMNRVKSEWFPNTVCEVVWQSKQFSWTHDGKSDNPLVGKQYNAIYKLAEMVYTGKINDITEGSTFYHADYVNPAWAKKMDRKVVKIGRHIFYWNKDIH